MSVHKPSRRQFLSLAPKASIALALPMLASRAFAQEAGLSAKHVSIGSSGALTGPLGGFGQELAVGVKAAMAQINSRGGVHGRELRFDMQDDAYQPARTVENVKKLVGSSFAMMSCIGTPNNVEAIPLIEAAQMPYMAPLTGAASLRQATLKNVFHVRASYTDETQRLVGKLVAMSLRNIAVVYLDNGYGKEVLRVAGLEMQRLGVQPVATIALAIDGKNMAQVVAAVNAAKPGAVLLGTAGAASTALIQAIKQSSPLLPLAGLSVTLTAGGVKELGVRAQGVAMTTVFPDPQRANMKLVRDYQTAMRASSVTELTYGSFEAYINTLILAEGLERAGRDVSRGKLRSALAGLRNHDMGGFVVGFDGTPNTPYVASKYVSLGVLNDMGRILT